MDNFFKSTTFKILITIAVILLSASIVATVLPGSTSPITKVVGIITTPLQDAASYLSSKFDNATGGFISSKTYQDRVAELEQQVAEYQSQLVDYEKTKKRLESYEAFLDVREMHPDYSWTYATVIGRDSADVFGSFTLDRGSADKVEVNDAVISGEYLIGVVTEVNATSCVVRSVFDPSVNVAAYEIRTGELGYVSANHKLSAKETCKLTGLDTKTAVSEGGIVCTSGTGGIFPKDLIIGTVTSVEQSETDLSSYAVVKPAVNANQIHDCFIITSYEGN